jgi:hypothetical protein
METSSQPQHFPQAFGEPFRHPLETEVVGMSAIHQTVYTGRMNHMLMALKMLTTATCSALTSGSRALSPNIGSFPAAAELQTSSADRARFAAVSD